MGTSVQNAIMLLKKGAFAEITDRILYKLGKSFFPLFFYDHIYIFERPAEVPSKREPSSIRVRHAAIDDLPAVCALSGKKREDVKNQLKDGDLCFVAENENGIVGMTWLKMGNVHNERVTGYRLLMPFGSAWGYDSLVHPDARRSGIWRSLDAYRMSYLKEIGKQKLFCMTRALNIPSIFAHHRCGYTLAKDIRHFRFLFFRTYFVRDFISRKEKGPLHAEFRYSSTQP